MYYQDRKTKMFYKECAEGFLQIDKHGKIKALYKKETFSEFLNLKWYKKPRFIKV